MRYLLALVFLFTGNLYAGQPNQQKLVEQIYNNPSSVRVVWKTNEIYPPRLSGWDTTYVAEYSGLTFQVSVALIRPTKTVCLQCFETKDLFYAELKNDSLITCRYRYQDLSFDKSKKNYVKSAIHAFFRWPQNYDGLPKEAQRIIDIMFDYGESNLH